MPCISFSLAERLRGEFESGQPPLFLHFGALWRIKFEEEARTTTHTARHSIFAYRGTLSRLVLPGFASTGLAGFPVQPGFVGVTVRVGARVAVFVAVGDGRVDVGVGVRVGGVVWTSTAPTSIAAPCGRAMPRWSEPGAFVFVPLSIAGLPWLWQKCLSETPIVCQRTEQEVYIVAPYPKVARVVG